MISRIENVKIELNNFTLYRHVNTHLIFYSHFTATTRCKSNNSHNHLIVYNVFNRVVLLSTTNIVAD